MENWGENSRKEGEFYSFGKMFLFWSQSTEKEPRLQRPFSEGFYLGIEEEEHKFLGQLEAGSSQRDFYFFFPASSSKETHQLAELYSEAT